MEKFVLVTRLTTLFVFAISINACRKSVNETQNVQLSQIGHYYLEMFPMTKTKTGNSKYSSVYIDTATSIPFLAHARDGRLLLINSKTDSIERSFELPTSIKSIYSISITDSEHWAIHHDSSFTWYSDGIHSLEVNSFGNERLNLSRHRAAYFPDNQLLAVVAIPRDLQGRMAYATNFISVHNLSDNTTNEIEFHMPEKYHDSKLGVPKVFLKACGQTLVVSFGYDEFIYLFDIISLKLVGKHRIESQFAKVEPLPFDKDMTSHEKKDVIQYNSSFVDNYESAFTNEERTKIWRLYEPLQPEKDGEYYLTGPDKGCHIIQIDLETSQRKEYILPNGQYYQSENWHISFSGNLPHLHYKKLVIPANNENQYLFSIHTFILFSF